MKFEIKNLKTGKVHHVDIDFQAMGRKSVKVRHGKMTKAQLSEHYRNISKGIKK